MKIFPCSLAGLALIVIGALGATDSSELAKKAKTTDRETATPADLAMPPIKTYDEACARCHGFDGVNFAGEFKNREWDPLRAATRDMIFGPSFLKATEPEVDAMTQYMFAILNGSPFAVVSNGGALVDGQADVAEGEVRPGTRIELSQNDRPIAVTLDGNRWTASIQTGIPFDISVEREGKTAKFRFPDRQWTGEAEVDRRPR